MKKLIGIILLFALFSHANMAEDGYKIGDEARDFKLKGVDGAMVSLSDYPDAEGFIVIFTCNHCPYSKAYEDRIIDLNTKYKEKGFPVIAINPNDPEMQPEDSFEEMVIRAEEKEFNFPYLVDDGTVYKDYGATRTPHTYLLKKEDNKYVVAYIGAIDDSRKEQEVKEKYLENAIDAVIKGKNPDPDFTKAVGCGIKSAS